MGSTDPLCYALEVLFLLTTTRTRSREKPEVQLFFTSLTLQWADRPKLLFGGLWWWAVNLLQSTPNVCKAVEPELTYLQLATGIAVTRLSRAQPFLLRLSMP